ncbi:hypothetical protein HGRIS_010897 [Hohenbuehelia grisea]|uniref:Zn(2)-C6 fungal-type domain-containing protein n=1 Tax=Hohenbuehelia grisea TaxID=104357 RepID=A0ABR3IY60_9AGAR
MHRDNNIVTSLPLPASSSSTAGQSHPHPSPIHSTPIHSTPNHLSPIHSTPNHISPNQGGPGPGPGSGVGVGGRAQAMIGPTSSFYDPRAAAAQAAREQEAQAMREYNQWYNSQHQHHNQLQQQQQQQHQGHHQHHNHNHAQNQQHPQAQALAYSDAGYTPSPPIHVSALHEASDESNQYFHPEYAHHQSQAQHQGQGQGQSQSQGQYAAYQNQGQGAYTGYGQGHGHGSAGGSPYGGAGGSAGYAHSQGHSPASATFDYNDYNDDTMLASALGPGPAALNPLNTGSSTLSSTLGPNSGTLAPGSSTLTSSSSYPLSSSSSAGGFNSSTSSLAGAGMEPDISQFGLGISVGGGGANGAAAGAGAVGPGGGSGAAGTAGATGMGAGGPVVLDGGLSPGVMGPGPRMHAPPLPPPPASSRAQLQLRQQQQQQQQRPLGGTHEPSAELSMPTRPIAGRARAVRKGTGGTVTGGNNNGKGSAVGGNGKSPVVAEFASNAAAAAQRGRSVSAAAAAAAAAGAGGAGGAGPSGSGGGSGALGGGGVGAGALGGGAGAIGGGPGGAGANKRKKRAHAPQSDSDDDSDDDGYGFGGTYGGRRQQGRTVNVDTAGWHVGEGQNSGLGVGAGMAGEIYVGLGGVGVQSSGGGGPGGSRLPGACTHCKKLKMKCDFPKGDNTCKRCKTGGHVCIVEGRKPRTAPNKREYLLAQIRQKDAIIESLLKQLHNPYIATPLSIASYRMATSPSDSNNRNIIAWLDRLQSSVQSAGGKGGATAFLKPRDGQGGEDDESEPESENMGGNQMQTNDDDATLDGNGNAQENADNIQSSLPDTHVPLGLIADLSLDGNRPRSAAKKEPAKLLEDEENCDDDDVGVANPTYFMPGPATDLAARANLIERHSPPEILVHGLVTPEDVDKLFDIFYTRVNPFISLLDPVLHTPALTFARCPFLFTVICAVSSRYYSEKSEIYPIAMHFAKHSAANALIDGWKSVELCQAYILMSIFAVPARRWEEDRSWLYTGLAIRIATDLNLHHVSTVKTQNEKLEREILNKTRVWMICFNLDRSTATQFGKPFTIKEDHIMRNSKEWYKASAYNHPYDVHLCAYTALLRIVARFHEEIFSDPDSPTGLNKSVDFRTVTLAHDEHLTAYYEEWSKRFAEDSDPNDPGCAFRCLLLPFLVEYSRLVMFSFGFQQAFQRGIQAGDQLFFTKCLNSAKAVIRNMVESLAPSGYMRFAPDGHFIFASFASAFLLKLLRPEFMQLLAKDQENEIFDLIGRLIQTLSSPEIAIDDRHTPRLYARFLAGLLSRHRRDGATVGRLHTQPPPAQLSMTSPTDFASTSQGAGSSGSGQAQGGTSSQDNQGGFSVNTFALGAPAAASEKQAFANTPVYRPEATYSASTGPIQFGGDFDMMLFGTENQVSEEEMLATMQALKNPGWWQNMMMPGFSWPEASPPAESPPALMHNVPGLHNPSFAAMQQVPLH